MYTTFACEQPDVICNTIVCEQRDGICNTSNNQMECAILSLVTDLTKCVEGHGKSKSLLGGVDGSVEGHDVTALLNRLI